MVQSGVDLAVGGVDGVKVTGRGVRVRLLDEAGEWTEQTHAQLDQQDAMFQSEGSQAIASSFADALDEAFCAQLAEIVAKRTPSRCNSCATNE